MKYQLFAAVVAAFASSVNAADAVKGAAEGFAKGKHLVPCSSPLYANTFQV